MTLPAWLSNSKALLLALAGLFLAGVVTGWTIHWAMSRPDPRAISRADSLATVLAHLEKTHDSVQVLAGARLDSLRAAETALRNAKARQPLVITRVDSFITLVPDTVLADSLRRAMAAERAVRDTALAASERVTALWQVRWETECNPACERYREMAVHLSEQLTAATRQPAGKTLVRDLVVFAAGIEVGHLLP